MLIEFKVGNYLSFKETVTFSMVASELTAKDKKLDENNVFQVDDDLSLLKSAAVYGANASGKSNLTKAIGFMRWFVLNSSKETQIKDKINVSEFRLSTETVDRPSFFEIVFSLDNKIYRYGFQVDKKEVVSEWLFHAPNMTESKLFERNLNDFEMTKNFQEGKDIPDKTRNNALFLSVVAQFNGSISQKILLWFSNLNIISGLNDDLSSREAIGYFENQQYRDDIINLIKQLDLGIENVYLKKFSAFIQNTTTEMLFKSIKTMRAKYDTEGNKVSLEEFDLDSHESEGTKKIFAFAGPILDVLKNGNILLIDEFDARFHSLITRTIVELFNSNETNPHNAQLIFMTHDTNLLSNKIFRRDQIWFTEKKKQGATDLYSLVEYKVENDASFESDYIKGKYGAIPFLGDLRQLITEPNE